ncbi:diacylglycerol kinase (ATP) [Pilibacter termitis]|uniref:Diacylglycerol kinase (ATP) n=1 Tax=Pilibacter termitis TaxID=263852 RepID=A0A1T4L5X5_9ENTE|nr:diacylglycerol kinase [Pilibacter termitis]SJZ49977.1 diacylglycerol kinase (ATP) [Pilibacter termitis]
MRARVIYNPTSGKEIMKKYLPDVLIELENLGYETSAFATTPKKHSARDEARRVALAGFDLIVAAGGDGTINEVVNGIASLPNRPKMAIIPAGTTNDYARALKVPRTNPVDAIRLVGKKQTVEMDIGRAGENYFINIAAGGGLTELTFEVPSELKTTFGYLAYLAKGAEMLPRIKPLNIRITHDEGVYEGLTSMFFAGLTNSVGGFESYAPDAKLDDGYFSLIIVKASNMVEIMRLIALLLNDGQHIADPKIIYVKTKQLTVEVCDENERMMLNLDGDYGGDAPMTFENLARHIEFFADLDEISDDAVLGYEEQEEDYEEIAEKFVHDMEKI